MSDIRNILATLENGQIDLKGQFMWGSNYTFLVDVSYEGATLKAVYKPTEGERPLWDFPSETLGLREVAAYAVSEALGWALVPPTAYRQTGPFGPGSIQQYIEHDSEYHYFNFDEKDRQRLHTVAIFDVIINNTDRKGGHILITEDEHVWVIDHGICFHWEPKLRTVLWDYAGEPLPENLCADVQTFRAQVASGTPFYQKLQTYISPREIAALARRADTLLGTGIFPHPPAHTRSYPWPLV